MAASADGLRRVASVVHVLCEADVLVGDQLESASPVDISFWPIHPTLERLYHWKVLHYGFDNRAFPDDETASSTAAPARATGPSTRSTWTSTRC